MKTNWRQMKVDWRMILGVSVLAVVFFGWNVTASAQVKKPPGRQVFNKFGKITKIESAKATAQGQATVGGQAVSAVSFELPADVRKETKPGQPVWLSEDGKRARFVKFPIVRAEKITKVVGRGPGKGKFLVTVKDVKFSNTGIINGMVKVESEDAIAGFTGAVAVRVMDTDGNDLTEWLQAGCWGVNMRSGRDDTWSVKVPPEAALNARKFEVKLFHSPCDRDRWDAALKKAEKAAEVAGKFVDVYTAVTAAGGS